MTCSESKPFPTMIDRRKSAGVIVLMKVEPRKSLAGGPLLFSENCTGFPSFQRIPFSWPKCSLNVTTVSFGVLWGVNGTFLGKTRKLSALVGWQLVRNSEQWGCYFSERNLLYQKKCWRWILMKLRLRIICKLCMYKK